MAWIIGIGPGRVRAKTEAINEICGAVRRYHDGATTTTTTTTTTATATASTAITKAGGKGIFCYHNTSP